MGGRHAGERDRAARGGLKYVVGLVVLATAGAAFVALRHDDSPAAAECQADRPVRVAVAPEIESVVAAAAERASASSCAAFEVIGEAPALTAQSVTIGDGAPDLWVPDSAVWVSRVSAQLVEGAEPPRTVVRSVATSPVVLAWPKGKEQPATWLHVLTDPTFTAGDPLATATAAAPLLAAYAEAARGVTPTAFSTVNAAQVRLAQRQSGHPPPVDATALLEAVSAAGGSTVVSEQAFNASAAAAAFDPVLPASGTLALGYPLVAIADEGVHDDAAKALGAALASDEARDDFAEAGFRSPLGEPLSSGRSVGTFDALAIKDASIVADTLTRWSLIAMPARALAVVDTSAPMRTKAGGATKMALTVQAALKGLALMPDSWALGSWTFASQGKGSKDWRELAPIRRLDAPDRSGTQRDRIVAATRRLTSQTGGRTSLYDATLAAYRRVQAQYDPKAVNSVIVLTGGRNDDPESISQAELLEALRRERDPARPVVVIAIGITAEADAFALQKIAEATGGQVYLARQPDEIADVFINALQARS